MRWSCPHCGINLAVADEKVGSGWSFSRCYSCGGFALVRRAEINVIKVDRAPNGENVLLPEASENPVMNQDATENLEKYLNNKTGGDKPTIKPASRRPQGTLGSSTPPPFRAVMENTPVPPASAIFSGLPNPLPDVPARMSHHRFLPAAIGIASMVTIASGIYLYVQGRALWEKTRISSTAAKISPTIKPASETRVLTAQTNSQALPSLSVVTDQVHRNAMAPVRTPIRNEDEETTRTMPFTVQVRSENISLYSGPGPQYPIVGVASTKSQYTVAGWNDHWFQIVPLHGNAKSADNRSGWIKNEQVQLIPLRK